MPKVLLLVLDGSLSQISVITGPTRHFFIAKANLHLGMIERVLFT